MRFTFSTKRRLHRHVRALRVRDAIAAIRHARKGTTP